MSYVGESVFEPNDIEALARAFDDARHQLGLIDPATPLAQMVALRIIQFAKDGERDPIRLREDAVRFFSCCRER